MLILLLVILYGQKIEERPTEALKRRLHIQFVKQKSLGKYLTQIFGFIKGQYLAQIKVHIVKQIECVDSAIIITGS